MSAQGFEYNDLYITAQLQLLECECESAVPAVSGESAECEFLWLKYLSLYTSLAILCYTRIYIYNYVCVTIIK